MMALLACGLFLSACSVARQRAAGFAQHQACFKVALYSLHRNFAMNCLLVIAHPLPQSLCTTLAAQAADTLRAAGHAVQIEDLYASGFAPALTPAERASYYAGPYDARAVQAQIDRLLWAQGLVLLFPTWWFGMPAMLKGWFDRWVMRQPVKRQLKTALLGTCAPQCRFRMLSLYNSERLDAARVAQFGQRMNAVLNTW
jgi:NAD(P)H dehydrogenase (quinone)